ncbi:MAG TPA: lipase family protein [Allosphingosinicella sp.]|nr:lipase family protein [Allosphingosinicella sp.]
MDHRWPRYDPSLQALLHPEERHPLGLYSAGDDWPFEAVCAEFARLAYFRFETEAGRRQLSTALEQAGFGAPACFRSDVPSSGNWFRRKLHALRDRDAQAFGATSSDGALTLLAFRGTQADRPTDLITDLSAWRTRFPKGGKVHTGFWTAYRQLHDQIHAWLAEMRPKRLVVTGHSLGAAMATLMAALHEEAELVTFGCPLVGNREFVSRLRPRSLRFVGCTDMVTTVPYRFLGYAHPGELLYIDRRGVVHRPAPDATAMEQDRARAKRDYRRAYGGAGNVPVRHFADHSPVNYVSAVAGKRPPAL